MKIARLTRAALTAALALLVAGCTMSTGNDDGSDDLLRAKRRWAASAMQDYQIVVQNVCFCGYTRPQRITVRSGAVVSRVDAETGEPVSVLAHHMRDIPGLFELIRDAIDRDAHSLSVIYDATYGFPLQINIDYIGNAVDDELQVMASQFQAMR